MFWVCTGDGRVTQVVLAYLRKLCCGLLTIFSVTWHFAAAQSDPYTGSYSHNHDYNLFTLLARNGDDHQRIGLEGIGENNCHGVCGIFFDGNCTKSDFTLIYGRGGSKDEIRYIGNWP